MLNLQIIDTFTDSVMSVCLTKTEIIGGSVDGTVRTFDMRIGRYVALFCIFISLHIYVSQISLYAKLRHSKL